MQRKEFGKTMILCVALCIGIMNFANLHFFSKAKEAEGEGASPSRGGRTLNHKYKHP